MEGLTLAEKPVELHSLQLSALNPAFESEVPEARLLPKDTFQFGSNFRAATLSGQFTVLLASLFLVGALSVTGLTIHNDWDAGFRYDALIGGLLATVVAVVMIRLGLTSYASLTLKSFSGLTRVQGGYRLGDIFVGQSSIDLEDAILRIVAWNIESGEEVTGSRRTRERRSFEKDTRKMVVYEKRIGQIKKSRSIESLCNEIVPLSQLCHNHCPPMQVSDFHGIGFGIEIRLVHPHLLDIVSNPILQGLALSGDEANFAFEDFLPQ